MTEQEKGVALDMERLDKRLASTGRWSRKEIKDMIRQGRILVNGLPARRPEEKVGDEDHLTVDGQEYWFDADGTMATGWRQGADGVWYYFRDSGAMAKDYWAKNGEIWYYLGSNGAMLKNTYTPDGYYVDATGAWVQ